MSGVEVVLSGRSRWQDRGAFRRLSNDVLETKVDFFTPSTNARARPFPVRADAGTICR
jgi:hypothetical protein